MWIVHGAISPTPERLAARAAHRERLAELHRQGLVRMAGPLADGTAAMVIFDVPDRRTLDELIAADPYYATPGVDRPTVHEWEPFLT